MPYLLGKIGMELMNRNTHHDVRYGDSLQDYCQAIILWWNIGWKYLPGIIDMIYQDDTKASVPDRLVVDV